MSAGLRVLLASMLMWATLQAPALAALPRLEPVVLAAPGQKGLDATRGHHHVRMAALADGPVVVAYSQGYAKGCALFDACQEYPETWHLAAGPGGLVAGPFRSWPEIDVRPGINNYARHPFNAVAAGDGKSVLVGLAHSSHNSEGGHFLRIDAQGRVLSRAGGVDAFGAQVCALGSETVAFVVWSDPSSAGYALFDRNDTLRSLVNLGGYGYNFPGTIEATCGESAALRSHFAVVAREVEASHFGFMLYRTGDRGWSAVGSEARVRWSIKGRPCCGSLLVSEDKGIVFARGIGPGGRRVIYFLRFLISSSGLRFLDAAPRALVESSELESLDSAAIAVGHGRYVVALHQAAAGGRPRRRQLLRLLSFDFATARTQDMVQPYEDREFGDNAPLDFYADSQNEDAIRIAQGCDGTLYVGGAMDAGQGKSVLRLFALKGQAAGCAR